MKDKTFGLSRFTGEHGGGGTAWQEKSLNTTGTKITKVKALKAKPLSPFAYFVSFAFEKRHPVKNGRISLR
jgi:hypothetical protein